MIHVGKVSHTKPAVFLIQTRTLPSQQTLRAAEKLILRSSFKVSEHTIIISLLYLYTRNVFCGFYTRNYELRLLEKREGNGHEN